MPTVLVQDGFSVRIHLPPREHGPPHVHVHRDGGSVSLTLPSSTEPMSVRHVFRMRNATVVAAYRLVEAHAGFLLAEWRKHHGEANQ